LEIRATASLAGIFFLRMFGLFLVVPVLSLYALQLEGATPLWIGVAMGTYGLTQACLQIPFGHLSDRYGRKPIIAVGLLLFLLGSAVAALSPHIWGVVVGRALQGSGAVAAAIMALAADLTRDQHRTKVMAGIGMSIGVAFALAFAAGPIIAARYDLSGIFWTAGGCGAAALLLLFLAVPSTPLHPFQPESEAEIAALPAMLKNPLLRQVNVSIFLLHGLLIASFVAIPHLLQAGTTLTNAQHWQIYTPAFVGSVVAMVLLMVLTRRRERTRLGVLLAILSIAAGELGLTFLTHSHTGLLLGLFLFFTGFNFLEANLPALVSRHAPRARRGTALGIYTTGQFLGTFAGGALAGAIANTLGYAAIPPLCALVTLAWAAWLARQPLPPVP
jgi:MFS family permease